MEAGLTWGDRESTLTLGIPTAKGQRCAVFISQMRDSDTKFFPWTGWTTMLHSAGGRYTSYFKLACPKTVLKTWQRACWWTLQLNAFFSSKIDQQGQYHVRNCYRNAIEAAQILYSLESMNLFDRSSHCRQKNLKHAMINHNLSRIESCLLLGSGKPRSNIYE